MTDPGTSSAATMDCFWCGTPGRHGHVDDCPVPENERLHIETEHLRRERDDARIQVERLRAENAIMRAALEGQG